MKSHKDDPCPYATMLALRMLGLTGKTQYQDEKRIGIETIFRLWEKEGNRNLISLE